MLFGFLAQFVFFMRFAVQWLVSERRGRSMIPISFWYISLAGGVMTFVYATAKQDIVIMTSQLLGIFIYLRNLVLIHRRRGRIRARRQRIPRVAGAAPIAPPAPIATAAPVAASTGVAASPPVAASPHIGPSTVPLHSMRD